MTATLYPGTYYVRGWYDAVGNTPALSSSDDVAYFQLDSWGAWGLGLAVAPAPTVVGNGSNTTIDLYIQTDTQADWPANPVYLKVDLSYSGGNTVDESHAIEFAFVTDPIDSPSVVGHATSTKASSVTLLCILNSATNYYLVATQDAAGTFGPSGFFVLNNPVLIYNNKGYSLTSGFVLPPPDGTKSIPDALNVTSNTNLNFTLTDNIKVTP